VCVEYYSDIMRDSGYDDKISKFTSRPLATYS